MFHSLSTIVYDIVLWHYLNQGYDYHRRSRQRYIFYKQKPQELKDESLNIHNASATDKVLSDTRESQTNKKPPDSGFFSNSSIIDYHGDVTPNSLSTARVSWRDELIPGSRSPHDKYYHDHFATTPLSQKEDKKSQSNIKPATFDGTGSWLNYRLHFNAGAMLNN